MGENGEKLSIQTNKVFNKTKSLCFKDNVFFLLSMSLILCIFLKHSIPLKSLSFRKYMGNLLTR